MDHEEMIQDCQDSDKLNGWEQDFMESISERLDRGFELTVAQAEKLEEIWDRIS